MSNGDVDTATAWDPAMEQLHAYHDGELHGLRRWRFERRLRRDVALRESLAELDQIASFVREDEQSRVVATPPAVWQSIAGSLDAIDAQIEGERAAVAAAGQAQPERATAAQAPAWSPLPAWFPDWAARWQVTAALAAAAVIAVVLVTSTPPAGPVPGSGLVAERVVAGSVRYIETAGRSVMVMDDQAGELTVLWLMDEV